MFKRREKAPFGKRMREMISPRKGWARGFEYMGRRIQRLPDAPESIGLGVACGVITSFTPFFGLHFVVAAGLAWILRANVFASAAGTFIGNPLTFPFIVTISLQLGHRILGDEEGVDTSFAELGFFDLLAHTFGNVQELFLPYLVGGLAPGLICAVISYALIVPLVRTYQARRRARLAAGARARLEAARAKSKKNTSP
ncbi:MAG: DUF2062 domain-containing protein [Pikeienuella sp.]